MAPLKIIVIFQILFYCYAFAEESRVSQAFLCNKLVPNIEVTAPERFISVNYSGVEVDLGSRLSPLQTLAEPKVKYEAISGEIYTFVFMGPYLPIRSTPRYTQVIHWLIVNIPGEDINSGDTVSSYFPPVPYPGGFPYLFLLYEQKERIDPEPLKNLSFILNRLGFDVVEFKKNYSLTGPVAGSFMREVYLPPVSKSSSIL